jgi:hypothetical protein
MQDHIFHQRDGPEYVDARLAPQLAKGRLSPSDVPLNKEFL